MFQTFDCDVGSGSHSRRYYFPALLSRRNHSESRKTESFVPEKEGGPADSPASSLLFLSLIDRPRLCAHFSLISHLLFQQRSWRVYISSLLPRSPSTTPPPHLNYSSFLNNQTPPLTPAHLYTTPLIRPCTLLRALILGIFLQFSAIYRKKVT